MPQIASFDSIGIFYHKSVAKEPKGTMMFVHGGFFGNHTLVKRLYQYFEKDYNIIAPDLRGKGDSGLPPQPENQKLDYYAKDLRDVLRNENIKSIILVGVSFGGLVSLKFFEMFREEVQIQKLILVSSTYTFRYAKKNSAIRRMYPGFRSMISSIDSVWPLNGGSTKSIDYSKLPDSMFHLFYGSKILMNNSVKTILGRYKVAFSIMDYEVPKEVLGLIDVPTLIVAGKKDKQIPFDIQQEMISSIRGSKYHIFLNAGHNLYLSKHKRTSQVMTDFLNA